MSLNAEVLMSIRILQNQIDNYKKPGLFFNLINDTINSFKDLAKILNLSLQMTIDTVFFVLENKDNKEYNKRMHDLYKEYDIGQTFSDYNNLICFLNKHKNNSENLQVFLQIYILITN